MNDPQTIISLTEEDRRLLTRSYLIGWGVYKWFLIGLAVVCGSLWLCIGWAALSDESLEKVFVIVTCILVVMVAFGWWTTPIYRTKTASPLEQDLREDRKIQKIGQIIAIKPLDEYNDKLIFQKQGQTDTEEFALNPRIYRVNGDALIPGREVELQYTPHALFLLSVRLLVPLTSEEMEQRQSEERTGIIVSFIILGFVCLGMGWLFGRLMWLPLGIIYAASIVLISGIIWYSKRKP